MFEQPRQSTQCILFQRADRPLWASSLAWGAGQEQELPPQAADGSRGQQRAPASQLRTCAPHALTQPRRCWRQGARPARPCPLPLLDRPPPCSARLLPLPHAPLCTFMHRPRVCPLPTPRSELHFLRDCGIAPDLPAPFPISPRLLPLPHAPICKFMHRPRVCPPPPPPPSDLHFLFA